MSSNEASQHPREIIQAEQAAYLDDLLESTLEWPVDVRIVYRELRTQLFKWGIIEAKDVVDESGIGSHDIYSRGRVASVLR